MVNRLLSLPFWLGMWITALQLSIIARQLGMSRAQLEAFIDEQRTMIRCVSWRNGCATLFAAAGIVLVTLVMALYFAGVL